MKKRLLICLLFCSIQSSAFADNFSYWWPWIYRQCNAATNGTNAWVWITLNSNTVNYVKTHTNLWDQCLTNGFLSASNDWAVVKVGNRFRLDYDTNTASGGTNAWNWITANSNSFNYMTGQTSKWDASWAWVDNYAEGYTNVIAWTNGWNSSWAWIQNYAPGYTNLIGWTNNWNASWSWIDAYAEGYTNLIGWTNSWNDSWTWVDYHAEGYTNVIGWTNDWNGSWTWIQNYAPGYTNLIGWTNNWNRSWDWVDFYAEGYTNLIGWTNAWNFIAANGATNAGAAGGPMYAMSNLLWTAFTPGAGSGTGDVVAAGNNVMSGSNTFTGPVMVGTNLWIGTVPTQVTAVVVADGALTPDADTLDGLHGASYYKLSGDTLSGPLNAAGNALTNVGTGTFTNLNMKGNIQLNGNWLSGDGGNEGIVVDANGMVGIGTNTPSSVLDILATPTVAPLILRSVGTASPGINMYRAMGTVSSPSNVVINTTLGGMSGFAYGATAYASGNRFAFNSLAAETWTDTSQGTYWIIRTTATNSTTITTRFMVQANGCFQSVPMAAFPVGPATGDTMYHSVSNIVYTWNGSAWKAHW